MGVPEIQFSQLGWRDAWLARRSPVTKQRAGIPNSNPTFRPKISDARIIAPL